MHNFITEQLIIQCYKLYYMQETPDNKLVQQLTQVTQIFRFIVVRLGKIILKAAKGEDIQQNVDKLGYHCQSLSQIIRKKTIQSQAQQCIKKSFKFKTAFDIKQQQIRNKFCNQLLQLIKCYQKQYVDQFLFKLMKDYLVDCENILLQYKIDTCQIKMLKKIYNAIVKCLHYIFDGSFDFSHNLFIPFNLIGKSLSSFPQKSIQQQSKQQIIRNLKQNSFQNCTKQSKKALILFQMLDIDEQHYINTLFQSKIRSNNNLFKYCMERNKHNIKQAKNYRENFKKYDQPKNHKIKHLMTLNLEKTESYLADSLKAKQKLQRKIRRLQKNNSTSENNYLKRQSSIFHKRTLSISSSKQEKNCSVSVSLFKGKGKRNTYNVNNVIVSGSDLSIQLENQQRVLNHKQLIKNSTAFLLRGFENCKKKILEKYRYNEPVLKKL